MSTDLLLTTHLNPPPLRRERVQRNHLIALLNQGLEGRLTLLSAPAGFGKTTLLREWIDQLDRPVAWLTMDEDDRDPATFLRYLIGAMERIGIRETPYPKSGIPDPGELQTVLTTMINQIAALRNPLVLILDDYHLSDSASIQAAFSFMLDHQPDNLHFVIATRADPALPLARLRGGGQLNELRLSDLRFTPNESAVFLNQVMRLGLGETDIAALLKRTEGWVAGLQIAAVSLKDRADAAAFIQNFTGSHRHVLDYLVEEVLLRQSDEIQTFLLQTSILDEMCGSLCEAVVDGISPGGGQQRLESLERLNLFVIPLDEKREWYRYHRLFADLLHRELLVKGKNRLFELHARASAWFESQDMSGDAIDHALKALDYERSIRLLGTAAEKAMMRGQSLTLLSWLEALPKHHLSQNPKLRNFQAWALLFSGRPLSEVEACLASQQVQTVEESRITAALQAPLLAVLRLYQGQYTESQALARLALEELPENERFLRSMAGWIASLEGMIDPSLERAVSVMDQFAESSRRTGNIMLAVMAICSQGDLHLSRGRLNRAEAIYRRALDLARDEQGRRLPAARQPLSGLAEVLREKDELEQAVELLKEAIGQIGSWQGFGTFAAYVSLAKSYLGLGDLEAAEEVLRAAEALAVGFDATQIDDRAVAISRVSLLLAQKDLAAASGWLERIRTISPDADGGVFEEHLRQHELIQMGRVLIALGRSREALEQLLPLEEAFEGEGRIRRLAEVLCLEALAYKSSGNNTAALQAFARALALAEAGGFVRVILDDGEPALELLRRLTSTGAGPVYAERLLERAERRSIIGEAILSASHVRDDADLSETLSQREQEVLDLLVLGLTNQEIADRLYLTLRTVKFHTTNIYAKLGVKSRAQAIARSRRTTNR